MMNIEEFIAFITPSPTFLVSYCILYVIYKIFLEFPQLIHPEGKGSADLKRSFPESARLCSKFISHRGSRAEGLPENTLVAFQDAIDSNVADIIELDVWLSKDGHVVVHHDETFTRMTSGKSDGVIHETNYCDFPTLIPPKTQCERLDDDRLKAGKRDAKFYTSVPLFKDVIELIPLSISIIIEFKQNSDELISKVHEIVLNCPKKCSESGKTRKDNVLWFSLQDPINVKLRCIDPSIPIIASVPKLLKTLLFHYCCILPFVSVDFDAMGIAVDEIDLARVRNEKSLKSLPDWVKRIIAYIFAGKPSAMMVSPSLFRHMRKRGIPTWFLGVNDSSDVKVAVDAGASGVLTDKIHWMKSFTSEHRISFKGLEPY